MVYTCVRFEKINFSDFWGPQNLLGPSKKTQLLDSWPLRMPLKSRPWGNHFKIFVLYLLHNYIFYSYHFNGLFNLFIFSIKAAYSFYNVAGSVSWVDLMSDALVLAKKLGKHFFTGYSLSDQHILSPIYPKYDDWFCQIYKDLCLVLLLDSKLFWTVQIILPRFWSSANCFAQVQFLLVGSKSFWTDPNNKRSTKST